MLQNVYGNHSIYAIVVAGSLMIVGAFAAVFVKDEDDPVLRR